MSRTFSSNEYIRYDTNVNFLGNGAVSLMMGWYYPTTLTSGNGYWSFNTSGATSMRIHSTTSEIALTFDRATTDSYRASSGAGITTNKWWFIATLVGINNVPQEYIRLWIGDETNRPTEVTVGGSPGSGNISVSDILYLGNVGNSSSQAFQGDIAWWAAYWCDPYNVGNSWHNCTSAGDISTTGGDYVFENIVIPWYLGGPLPHKNPDANGNLGQYNNGRALHLINLDNINIPAVAPAFSSATPINQAIPSVVNSPAWSYNRPIYPCPDVAIFHRRHLVYNRR